MSLAVCRRSAHCILVSRDSRLSPRFMVSFLHDIRPQFRPKDRDFMSYLFDLWDLGDVTSWAEPIYQRLVEGTMPCDEPWEAEQVRVMREWIDGGCLP